MYLLVAVIGVLLASGVQGVWKKTRISIQKTTVSGQDVFIRGGSRDQNSQPIRINYGYLPGASNEWHTWNNGDYNLDWHGKEPQQHYYQGKNPEGSPLTWTSGHWWVTEFYMDCGTSNDKEYFQFKGYCRNCGGWESNINSDHVCKNKHGGHAYYVPGDLQNSQNHVARCGHDNVYTWGQDYCQCNNL